MRSWRIPRCALKPCPLDEDYVLVHSNAVTLEELDEELEETTTNSSTGGAAAAAKDTAASSTGGAEAAAEKHTPPPTAASQTGGAATPRIVSRPQVGNGQNVLTMMHKWAGRRAGGFGRPAGYSGDGKYAKWAHRHISSVTDMFNREHHHVFLEELESRQVQLFDRWLNERMAGYVTKVQGAPQYRVEFGDRPKPKSVYYRVAVTPGILEADQWTESWHGTYIYFLWNIMLNGLRPSGVRGEGGDNHVWDE